MEEGSLTLVICMVFLIITFFRVKRNNIKLNKCWVNKNRMEEEYFNQ